MLSRHVRVETVSRFGHCATQNTSVARADCVFIFHVSSQGVGRSVDFTTFGAGSGISGSHAHHFKFSSNIDGVHVR